MRLILLAPLVVGGTMTLSVLGMLLVRRSLGLTFLRTHHEVGGVFLGVVGVLYGILLAFVVLVVWEDFESAKAEAAVESNQARDLSRLAAGLGAQLDQSLQLRIIEYARSVVDDEWDEMARGRESARTADAITALWDAYLSIEVSGERQAAVLDQSLTKLADLSDSRRLRLHTADDRMPGIVWSLLVGGAAVTIAFTYFFGVQSALSQGLMTAMLSGLIGFILLLVLALNHPFGGDVKVRPEEMRKQLAKIEAEAG